AGEAGRGGGADRLPWDSSSLPALTRTLVGWVRHASVSDTEDERRFGERLLETIRSLPYFRSHPAQVQAFKAAGDCPSPVVAAWVAGGAETPRGRRRPVVILAGHYDTVGGDAFGPEAGEAAAGGQIPDDVAEAIRS